MDHYGDGIRRCLSSTAVSDGGVDESRQNCELNDSSRHKQRVQKLGLRRRSPMGGHACILVYHKMAKVSVRGTDCLHHTHEHKNAVIHR